MDTPAPGISSASAEPTREGEADPRAREAPRARSHDERVEVGRGRSRAREEVVHVADQRPRGADPLAEHAAVQDERARRDVGRGVEGENQH